MVIEINYLEDLDNLRNDSSENIYLMRDLDFNDDDSYSDAATNKPTWTTGAGFPPIPVCNSDFYGEGYTISNLYMNTTTNNTALIQDHSNCTISDLKLKNINITSTGAYTACFVSHSSSDSKLRRCAVLDGSFTGGDSSGVLVAKLGSYSSMFGNVYGDIVDCISNINGSMGANSGQFLGDMSGTGNKVRTSVYLGSGGELIGLTTGFIRSCFYNSDINTSNKGTGKTTAELNQLSTYTDEGYNMVSVGDHDTEIWFLADRARLWYEKVPTPFVVSNPPDNITRKTARLYVNVLYVESVDDPVYYKFKYRKTGDTTWLETTQTLITVDGVYYHDIDGLDQETEYEYRAIIVIGDE